MLDLPMCTRPYARTHGANKSILFAQIFDPYEITLRDFAQIKDDIFAHLYKALSRVYLHLLKFGSVRAIPSDFDFCAKMYCFICSYKRGTKPCTREQIKYSLVLDP